MAKANQFLNSPDCEVQSGESTDRKETQRSASRAMLLMGMCIFMTVLSIGGAAANSTTMNWTQITDMLSGVTTIFPSIGDMIVAIVPTLMVLAVVGFVLRFFDSIISMIESATRIFK